ncbi:MAG: hypothetical protein QXU20_00040 [Candidatus Woesearchaeota archaeon]
MTQKFIKNPSKKHSYGTSNHYNTNGAFIQTIADIIMKKWVLSKNSWIFVLGLFVISYRIGFFSIQL